MTKFMQFAPVACVALGACATTTPASSIPVVKAPTAETTQLFAQVKGLEGAWEMAGPDGKPAITEFHVTSGGTAVREVMFPGTGHEMTNLYHMDGPTIAATHYCAEGNQPRMRAVPGAPGVIAFHFDSATNVTSPDQAVMGDLTLTLDGKDHLVEEWHSPSHGASKEETMKFSFTRLKPAAAP